MAYTTTLRYDAALIREAVFCFWHRTVGWVFFVALAVVAGSVVVMIWQGDRSWLMGLLASVVVVGIGFVVMVFLVHYRNAMSKFQGMTSRQATFVAMDTTLSMSSELGSSTLPWSAVKEVWRFDRVWLLLFSKAQFVTLPVESLPAELQAFLLEQVKAAGGRVA